MKGSCSGLHTGLRQQDTLFRHSAFSERIFRVATNQPSLLAMKDSSGVTLSVGELADQSKRIAGQLHKRSSGMQYIGLLLPTSVNAAVVSLAALSVDNIPVFLNYTSSKDSINHAIAKCEMRLIISSQKFLETLRLSFEAEILFVEDILNSSYPETAAAICPSPLEKNTFEGNGAYPNRPQSVNGTATVVFSSGSTGTPKGVVLSHKNLDSNANSVLKVLRVEDSDTILGSLPLFHSFGFLAAFWLPLYRNIPVVYHSNPMDAATIGRLVKEHQCTILFATPTFLQAYIRKCSADELKSLRTVITGAEKLTQRIANQFFDKFGVMPIEGYGCTELSPVVSINVPEFHVDVGKTYGKFGSVGKPLPGVTVKTVAPETGEELPTGHEGLLWVQGPNVMQGYLGEPEKTREAIHHGWYNTGDMAKVDEDGYIFITGRYSRFSKIGGEMVPHGGIEDEIHSILGVSETKVIVTAVPDSKRGERLIVLHLPIEKTPDQIIVGLRQRGLTNIWIPKSKDFYPIEDIPLLGSGKLDLKQVSELSLKLNASEQYQP